MNREQAMLALRDGKTLTHKSFTSSEWVKGIGSFLYEFEDGVKCDADEFWRFRQDKWFDCGWAEIKTCSNN